MKSISIAWSLFLVAALAVSGCSTGGPMVEEIDDADAGMELPMTDEPTRFRVNITNVSTAHSFLSSGIINTPVGNTMPGPLFPGGSYETLFAAAPGDHLSLASMMIQSNDLFFSMNQWGVPLFNEDGTPRSTDLTGELNLYDAGTEANQELGTGSHQAPRQSGADDGPIDDNDLVRLATIAEFSNLPAVSAMISARIEYEGAGLFRLTVSNVSNPGTLRHSAGSSAVPVGPVAWVVHRQGANPVYALGEAERGEGLQSLAEDGNPASLAGTFASETGVTSPISPGAYAVHSEAGAIFNTGNADRGAGLELQAEAGNPSELVQSLTGRADVTNAGVFNTVIDGDEPGPAFPGQSYEFEIEASPGDRLSFATMYIQSNDLFVSFGDAGLELFNRETPIDGDVSGQLQLLDAGTEVNEIPGAGPFQAPRQQEADGGVAELGVVRMVDDEFENPLPWEIVRVTVTPL